MPPSRGEAASAPDLACQGAMAELGSRLPAAIARRLPLHQLRKTATGPTARMSLWAAADQGTQSAANFLTSLLLARLCTPKQFGAYVLASSALLAGSGLQGALVTGPMTVLGAGRDGEDWKSYATTLAMAQVLLGTLMAALAAAAPLGWLGLGEDLRSVLWAMSAALPLVQAREFCRQVLYTRLRASEAFFNNLFYCLAQVTGVILLWQLGGQSANGVGAARTAVWLTARNVFLVMAIVSLAGTVVGLWQIRLDLTRRVPRASRELLETWQFSRWKLGNQFGTLLAGQASLWAIGGLKGTAGVGMVEAARLVFAPLQILWLGVPKVLDPRAVRLYERQGARPLRIFLKRLLPLWSAPFLTYGLVVLAAPGYWLDLLFGEKYEGARAIVTLWALVYVLLGLRVLPTLVLNALKRPDVMLFVSLPVGVLTVLSTAGLTGWAGLDWAVGGRVMGDLLALIATGFSARTLLARASKSETVAG